MKYNEKTKEYTMKYLSKSQHEVRFRIKNDIFYNEILPYIDKSGLKIATFIKHAIKEKIERDNPGVVVLKDLDKSGNDE